MDSCPRRFRSLVPRAGFGFSVRFSDEICWCFGAKSFLGAVCGDGVTQGSLSARPDRALDSLRRTRLPSHSLFSSF